MHSKVVADKFLEKHVLMDVFSRADCEELDRLARKGQPKEFTPLSDEMLCLLRRELNIIASRHKVQDPIWYLTTAHLRLEHATEARKHAKSLLKCFNLSPHSKEKRLNPGHSSPGGIFEHDESDPNAFVRSLFHFVELCNDRIRSETLKLADKRKKNQKYSKGAELPNPIELLVARLAIVYGAYWGNGVVGNTVDDQGRGGPSVRFVQAAASQICDEPFLPSRISHLIGIWKKRQSASTNA